MQSGVRQCHDMDTKWPSNWSAELIFGASGLCKTSPVGLEGPRGQVWLENDQESNPRGLSLRKTPKHNATIPLAQHGARVAEHAKDRVKGAPAMQCGTEGYTYTQVRAGVRLGSVVLEASWAQHRLEK